MDEITKIWPKWKTAGLLGKGSFGNVYKVLKEDFGGEYYAAVKVIRIPQDETEVIELQNTGMDAQSIRIYYEDVLNGLVNEIKIMERLKTAGNIVSIEDCVFVEDAGKLGWTLYIRMELLESLDAYVQKNGILDVTETVKMGIDICSALECCEQSRTIHRDIKPGNIFRNPYGGYKLGDFGISKQMEGTQSMRSQKGTRMYMAPEIYRGESYDNTVDIYSLGITLYRFLNKGRIPFLPEAPKPIRPGDLEKAIHCLISGNALEPPADGDETLTYIVRKACAYRAKDRYQNAAEMKGDLLKWQLAKKFHDEKTDMPRLDGRLNLNLSANEITADTENPNDPPTLKGAGLPDDLETQKDANQLEDSGTHKDAGLQQDSKIPPNHQVLSQESFNATQGFREEKTYHAFSSTSTDGGEISPQESLSEDTYHAFPEKPPGENPAGEEKLFGESPAGEEEPPQNGGARNVSANNGGTDAGMPNVNQSDAGAPDADPLDARVSDVSEFIEKNFVKFGAYYQEEDKNEKTPIEWEVIKRNDDLCLLLSRYVLDYRCFHEDGKQKATWSASDLREWLNDDFIRCSFTEAEQNALYSVRLENADYKNKTKIDDLVETWDKVFCLSLEEIEDQYHFTEEQYRASATEYARQKIKIFTKKDEAVSWWLRSVNRKKRKALVALPVGNVGFYPPMVNECYGVRPAIWVDISKL